MKTSLGDLAHLAVIGLRSRRLRTLLCALGIAVGIAAMVAVLGLSASSRAKLIAQVDALGTNLLTVAPGQSPGSPSATLPVASVGMVRRIGPVQEAAAVEQLAVTVRRNDRIDVADTGGVAVDAADPQLAETLRLRLAGGRFLDRAMDRYPTVVLGAQTATYLGIDIVDGRAQVSLGGHEFTVIGILDPVLLAPDLDRAALVSFAEADSLFGPDGSPSTIYVRSDPSNLDSVQQVLALTADPASPQSVSITRPSDALAARAAATSTLLALFIAMSGVALLVGGIGVANMLVVSVLERRAEIGIRRALGATRHQIALQFLGEAIVLSALGGAAGVGLGAAISAAYSFARGWTFDLPPSIAGIGIVVAITIGALAGLYPAHRAAQLAPTEALRSR
jgi:putative ABC transport system permease protein